MLCSFMETSRRRRWRNWPACVPVFKALRVGPDFSAAALEKYPDAFGFLFDAADGAPGQYGGTGRLADWGVAQQAARGHRIISGRRLDRGKCSGGNPAGPSLRRGRGQRRGIGAGNERSRAVARFYSRSAACRSATERSCGECGEIARDMSSHSQIAGVGTGPLWPVRRQVCARNADGAAVRTGARLRNCENGRKFSGAARRPAEEFCRTPNTVAICLAAHRETGRPANLSEARRSAAHRRAQNQ